MSKGDEESLMDDITPGMTTTLSSRDKLEVTITRSCLDVLSQLGEAFSNAVSNTTSYSSNSTSEVDSPFATTSYVVKNDIGICVLLVIARSQLRVSKCINWP